MSNEGKKFWGKYRGIVSHNDDGEGQGKGGQKLGRIRAVVPDVFGTNSSGWALPCVPYAGDHVGWFAVPPEGAWVWIEFEQGNPDKPIWSGCFWQGSEVPVDPYTPDRKVLKTGVGTLTINDGSDDASLSIELAGNKTFKIVMSSKGIVIDNGDATVKLDGKKVSINGDSLEVNG